VVDQVGEVLANRNVSNGVRPILSVIGGLPTGMLAAFEAAFGWGWLLELLEDYGFEPHMVQPRKAIASARLKNDKVDAEILAQLLRADLLPQPSPTPAQATDDPGHRASSHFLLTTEASMGGCGNCGALGGVQFQDMRMGCLET